MISNALKIIIPSLLAFWIGIAITPTLTNMMYKHRLWKRKARKDDVTDKPEDAINPDFKKIHNTTAELSTPRIGGIIIWIAITLTVVLLWIVSNFVPENVSEILDFFSRGQTLIPLFAFLVASLIGLADDLLQIFGGGRSGFEGLSRYTRFGVVVVIGLIGALWFFLKLDISSIAIPFTEIRWEMGWMFVPFFVVVVLGTFSSGVIDGIDGLSGGVLAIIYSAFAMIAYFTGLYDIAALCGVIAGGTLAFLWFNIPPARFYMGETGMLGLTITLAIVAFLTDSVLLLPVIAFPLVATSLSSAIQLVSKKFFGGKKVFKIAPLHHHFEALGWSREKITMRYWVLTVFCAFVGLMIAFL
ncbi:MAG: hypothetical protein OEX08_00200 [Candidatus Nomurabacteria bacterium]|nr:hypothetical protein [Candidatus Nomurabacteria bacterium]